MQNDANKKNPKSRTEQMITPTINPIATHSLQLPPFIVTQFPPS